MCVTALAGLRSYLVFLSFHLHKHVCEGTHSKYFGLFRLIISSDEMGEKRVYTRIERSYVLEMSLSIKLSLFVFLLSPILLFLCTKTQAMPSDFKLFGCSEHSAFSQSAPPLSWSLAMAS